MKLNIYSSPTNTACSLILHIVNLLKAEPDKIFNIAFSGGFTPAVMFDLWANELADITPWHQIKFWWVDERCVRPENSDSNFGSMRSLLLNTVPVMEEQVFRIHGENEPEREVVRYSSLVKNLVPAAGKYPVFDIVLLGVGEDGHTSSIFPGQEHLLISSEIYAVSRNPYNGQKRIALTGQPIINSRHVFFLVTGKKKSKAVIEMCSSGDTSPAAYIAHRAVNSELFIDEAIAEDLKEEEREIKACS